jgi:hypothetical protein
MPTINRDSAAERLNKLLYGYTVDYFVFVATAKNLASSLEGDFDQ